MHKQIFLTFRLIAGLQRAVNVPRHVNLNVVNPLLPNHVNLTFTLTNVSVHQSNHLAAVNLLQLAASRLAVCVAGSKSTAAIQNQAAIPVTREMPAVLLKHVLHQLLKPAVLLHQKLAVLRLLKHVPHQLLKPAVLLLQKPAVHLLLKHVPHQLLKLAVLLHQRPAVHQLLKPAVLLHRRLAAQLLRPVPHQLPAAKKNLAATQILAKSQN
ncbi:MAG: hypothetical protein KDA77_10515 [Planctomycetaceae bacterium]|nr:hypothetical protein [Planctomycetaceae bacterium]